MTGSKFTQQLGMTQVGFFSVRIEPTVRKRGVKLYVHVCVLPVSTNVTDHQVAALDDLATTNRGHRHAGASVGYLISSVSSPIRTSTRSIVSIASIRSSQIESLIERNYVSNRREQVSVDIEQKNRKASKRSNRSLPGYRKRSSVRTQIVYLRLRSKVKSVVWSVPFHSMNCSGKRLGAIFRESKRRRRLRNRSATSSGCRSSIVSAQVGFAQITLPITGSGGLMFHLQTAISPTPVHRLVIRRLQDARFEPVRNERTHVRCKPPFPAGVKAIQTT